MTRERMLEIVRFCFVGGVSFLMDYGLLFVLTEFVGLYYLYSSAISFSVTVVFNYWLCVIYVFKGAKKQTTRQAIIFFGTGVIGLGLNQLCMWFFVDVVKVHYMLAKIFATAIVTIWNYVTKRKAVTG
ncbi:MAG: GtrA family protein [Selenomonadaceae bacterium]|nr:GtrA family protein [Selenomonadaceae bacterium]MBR0062029.1 GtrA family protein [Selenomonadaceae bacterium]MBR0102925.1 GtrA family protein [Selenomonadaceae bacterium]